MLPQGAAVICLVMGITFIPSTSTDPTDNPVHPDTPTRLSAWEKTYRTKPPRPGGAGLRRNLISRNYSYPESGMRTTTETSRHRFKREIEEMPEYCNPFVVGQPDQQMFFSPGYPGNYPNGSSCITVLSARQGQLIKLDFRNYFEVELSPECRYDYLEIKDGAHGYSPVIGKYCGNEFPPMITSQGRHLWLSFHSDDNIEYRGFTAVYEFITKPTPPYFQPDLGDCQFDVNGTEGVINKTDISQERIQHSVQYGLPLECMWIITVKKNQRIQLTFDSFVLQKPNECESNFIELYNRTDTPFRLKTFCGSIADPVESTENILYIRFVVEPRSINSTFSAMYTAFREKEKGTECVEGEYDCEDSTCIDEQLKCNGRINCRYKWDEADCSMSKGSPLLQSEHIVIILTVFTLILAGMSIVFVFNCIKTLINDHRIIQEHIRMSREGNLDSAGCMTKVVEPVSKINLKQENFSPKSRAGSEQLENMDCYVPGVGEVLPILLQNNIRERSADPSIPQINRANEILARQQSMQKSTRNHDSESDDQVDQGSGNVPEMCDSCCQTRESLFHTPSFHQSGSDRSFSPVNYPRKKEYSQESAPFSTFGYSGSTAPKSDPKYRAEAVIEMERFEDNGNYGDSNKNFNKKQKSNDTQLLEDQLNKNQTYDHKRIFDRRPYSVETTKSAPDVIIMTKSH